VLSLTRQDQRICIASLEMKPIQTLARMARQALGEAEPGPRQVRGFAATLDGALWLYDQQGTVAADRMLALCRYCREELDVGHVVIDSLMKCGLGVDDYNGQKHFVDALSTYAKDSGLHIHLVAHSRKRENEREVMNKFDIKGAGDITDMADNVFNVWRNKGKEQALEKDPDLIEEKRGEPDALLLCDKQRNGDWEGRVALWFNRPALQYLAKPGMPPIDYMRGTPGGLDL
jgi:twinkle protein